MSITSRGAAALLTATTGAIVLAGCQANKTASNADLTGVGWRKPDRIDVVQNIDGHPNMVRLCIGGLAFYTVTDGHQAARQVTPFVRMPEWDASFCGASK